MKRAASLLAVVLIVSIVVGACASMQSGGRDLVAKAVQAQGGADALGAVKTVSYKATVRQWEPEQSQAAGGEMRMAGDSTVVEVRDMGALLRESGHFHVRIQPEDLPDRDLHVRRVFRCRGFSTHKHSSRFVAMTRPFAPRLRCCPAPAREQGHQ